MRSELVGKLPLNSGDSVLDLGCGTGNWTILAAERVGIHGLATGVDRDPESLEQAERRKEVHPLSKIIQFRKGNLEDLQVDFSLYDRVFLFNVLSYLPAAEAVLRRVCHSMRTSTLIFIKDTDIQSDFFWPVPFELYSRLMSAATSGCCNTISGTYNPFFARELPKILNSIGSIRTTTLSQSFSLFGALAQEEREYVRTNANMLATIARQNGDAEVAEAWLDLFDEGEHCILDNEEFMYTMTEFVFQVALS